MGKKGEEEEEEGKKSALFKAANLIIEGASISYFNNLLLET